jgi:ABC-type multidrug transport system fused ATPase/permease subunit
VIVFDEGTSALDRTTETALVTALDTVRGGRTLICVAHRIATLRDADKILIVESGRVTAGGTHDELQRTNSTFRSLSQ